MRRPAGASLPAYRLAPPRVTERSGDMAGAWPRYHFEARLSHKSRALERSPTRVAEATPTPRPHAESPWAAPPVVGRIDNERPSSRTYATASGNSSSARSAARTPGLLTPAVAERGIGCRSSTAPFSARVPIPPLAVEIRATSRDAVPSTGAAVLLFLRQGESNHGAETETDDS
jgi:hypothetical protein